ARTAALDIRALAPDTVGQALQLLQECSLRVVDDALHYALDDFWPVTLDQREHSVAGGDVTRELGAKIERDRLGLARGAQVELLDVAPDLVLFHDFHRRDTNAFLERVFRRAAERRGRDAAEVVLVPAIGHPAEELAFPEHGADPHHVLLVRCADPRIVGEGHVSVAGAWVVGAILEDRLHLRIADAGRVLPGGTGVHE